VVAITKPRTAPARKRRVRREHLLFLAFIAPNFFLLGVFSYWPLLYQAYLSMTRWDMISPTKTFVGANNYRFMFDDPSFHRVLLNTGYFTGSVLVGSLVLGLALAMLLNQRLRGRTLVRGIVFAPFVLSGAAIGLVWSYIFDPVYGLMRVVLGWFGIGSPNWLVSTAWAMPALIIVYLWKNAGYSAIIYLAGLQNIPNELYDAAKVDGVTEWQKFRYVTLPLLSPTTFFLLVTTMIFSIQAFDVIAVMTKGGPVNATTTLIWYLYQQGFVAFRAGLAAAAGMLLFVLLLVVTLFQVYFVQRRVHYS
jgi:ABC-type sugar transport system permease subunit